MTRSVTGIGLKEPSVWWEQVKLGHVCGIDPMHSTIVPRANSIQSLVTLDFQSSLPLRAFPGDL